MTSFFKSIAMNVPAVRERMRRVLALAEDRNRLEREVEQLTPLAVERDQLAQELDDLKRRIALAAAAAEKPLEDWSELKQRKRKMSEEIRATAATSRLTP